MGRGRKPESSGGFFRNFRAGADVRGERFMKHFPTLLFLAAAASAVAAPSSLVLSANGPAVTWDTAYGVGNGRLGAIAYGDFSRSLLVLNESSIFSTVEVFRHPEAKDAIRTVRTLCRERRLTEADELMRTKVIGTDTASGSYRPAAILVVEGLGSGVPASVRRELDMGAGLASERYEFADPAGKRVVTREITAAAAPYDVIAVRYASDRPMTLAFAASWDAAPTVNGKAAIFGTSVPKVLENRAEGDHLVFSGDAGGSGGTRFESRIRILPGEGGSVRAEGGRLIVSGAKEILVLAATCTDFDPQAPNERAATDRAAENTAKLAAASAAGWKTLRDSSAARFAEAMARCRVDLGDSSPETLALTTPERLARVTKGGEDPDLFEQMFQFGRYCTVSSSRPGALPPGLQGIWNPYMDPPWFGSYTLNINAEMNQWPTETTGLGEYHTPFLDFVRGAQPSGEAFAARIGHEGLCFGHACDIRRGTWFGRRMTAWGAGLMNGAWMGSHLADHYRFSGDKADLARSLPFLRESARFVLSWFEADPKTGEFLSGPGASPENAFLAPGPKGDAKVSVSLGCGYDQALGRQALRDYLFACRELGRENDELFARVAARLPLTPPPRVMPDGRLGEWREDFREAEPNHRHVSHLLGLFPGDDIAVETAPDAVAAARRSLEGRLRHGGGNTGWSAAWMANLHANAGDGENAFMLLRRIVSKYTNPNLFNMHPPFQMDGNFGFTSAVAECLIRSRADESGRRVVTLLPALPSAWKTGSAEGLRARGGLVADLRWDAGKTRAELRATRAGAFRIRCGKAVRDLDLKAGETVSLAFGE